jgi:hypothetical protein
VDRVYRLIRIDGERVGAGREVVAGTAVDGIEEHEWIGEAEVLGVEMRIAILADSTTHERPPEANGLGFDTAVG